MPVVVVGVVVLPERVEDLLRQFPTVTAHVDSGYQGIARTFPTRSPRRQEAPRADAAAETRQLGEGPKDPVLDSHMRRTRHSRAETVADTTAQQGTWPSWAPGGSVSATPSDPDTARNAPGPGAAGVELQPLDAAGVPDYLQDSGVAP